MGGITLNTLLEHVGAHRLVGERSFGMLELERKVINFFSVMLLFFAANVGLGFSLYYND